MNLKAKKKRKTVDCKLMHKVIHICIGVGSTHIRNI